jgi:hypothetical protein
MGRAFGVVVGETIIVVVASRGCVGCYVSSGMVMWGGFHSYPPTHPQPLPHKNEKYIKISFPNIHICIPYQY